MLSRNDVCKRLGEHYSRKFNGVVWAVFDDSRRSYLIRGSGLPSAPEVRHLYPHGWELLDYIRPTEARKLIAA